MEGLYIEVLFDIVSLDRSFTYLYSGDDLGKVRVGAIVFGRIHGRREKGWIVEVGVDPPTELTILEVDEVTNLSIAEDFKPFVLEMQQIYGGSFVHYVKLIDSAASRLPLGMRSRYFSAAGLGPSVEDQLSTNGIRRRAKGDYGVGEGSGDGEESTLESSHFVGVETIQGDSLLPKGDIESIRISPNVSVADVIYSQLESLHRSQRQTLESGAQLSASGTVSVADSKAGGQYANKILVLYPDAFQMHFDEQRLLGDGLSVVIADKPLSAKAREQYVTAQVILGTRSSAFAPIVGLSKIIVVDPTSAGHRSISYPRVDTASIALIRKRLHGTDLLLATGFPDPSLHRIARPKGDPNDINAWPIPRVGKITVSSRPVSEEVIDWIGETRQSGSGPLLVIYNKKGRVNRYICRSCKEVVSCEVCNLPLVYGEVYNDSDSSDVAPVRRYNFHTSKAEEFFDRLQARGLYCPNCHRSTPFACGICKGSKIKVASMGSQRIADELWGTFADQVVHLDSDSRDVPQTGIVVGTSMLLNRYRRAMGVALLDIDALASQFGYSSINRLYEAWFKASRILVGSPVATPLYLGTRSIDSGYAKAIIERRPRDLYQYDLESRRDFFMPPFSFQMKVVASRNSTFDLAKIRDAFLEAVVANDDDSSEEGLMLDGGSIDDSLRGSIYDLADECFVLVAANEKVAYGVVDRARAKVGNCFLLERLSEDI